MKRPPWPTIAVLACLSLCACAGGQKESRIIDLSLKSDYMGRKVPCKVYLPKGYGDGKRYSAWYALNGYSLNETMWIKAGIAESADGLIDKGEIEPIIMVFPYTMDATMQELAKDMEDNGKFSERNMDRFLCRELVPYIDSHYDTVKSADGRYIGGYSMGGAIALRVALHHTDLFSKVGGYTPAVTFGDYSDKQLEQWLSPNDDMSKIDDITRFDKRLKLDRLAAYLDAGDTNDPFSARVRSLFVALQKRGINSEFHLYSGGHSLDHNKRDFGAYLKFYSSKGFRLPD